MPGHVSDLMQVDSTMSVCTSDRSSLRRMRISPVKPRRRAVEAFRCIVDTVRHDGPSTSGRRKRLLTVRHLVLHVQFGLSPHCEVIFVKRALRLTVPEFCAIEQKVSLQRPACESDDSSTQTKYRAKLAISRIRGAALLKKDMV